jgi:hypothetical protein
MKYGTNYKYDITYTSLCYFPLTYLGLGFCSGGNILSAPSSSFFPLPAIENRVIFLKQKKEKNPCEIVKNSKNQCRGP